jgi:hypothetical protein
MFCVVAFGFCIEVPDGIVCARSFYPDGRYSLHYGKKSTTPPSECCLAMAVDADCAAHAESQRSLSFICIISLHRVFFGGHARAPYMWMMRAAANSSEPGVFAALEVSLTALTALQSLDLSGEPSYFVAGALNCVRGL